MRSALRLGASVCCVGLAASAAAQSVLAPVPLGSTLPVRMEHTLDAKHAHPGDTVKAQLIQRVPLGDGRYLPTAAELVGFVTAVSAQQLCITWTELRLHAAAEPVHVKLLAGADSFDVEQARIPLGGPTFSTSDWTLKQIGGDEVYGVNEPAKVYDRYSQLVGRADGTGVYAPPLAPGLPERAMGPFSTTFAGLYDMPELTIVSAGDGSAPMVLGLTGTWRLRANSALLLEVVAP